MVAILRESLSMVTTNKTVGNELKSRGLSIKSDVINIKTESVIEILKRKSTTIGGIGKISTPTIQRTPTAKKISKLRFEPEIPFKIPSLSNGRLKLPMCI